MQIQSVGTQYTNALSALGTNSATDSSGDFQNMLSDAINAADQTDAVDQQGTAALLSGDTNSLSDAVVQSQKADLALDLTVQIRNRMVDAYTEVMRMQV